MSWLSIEQIDPLDGRATKVWAVWAADGGSLLGRIAWYAPWRKYAFIVASSRQAGAGQVIFEQDCLREIADHCE